MLLVHGPTPGRVLLGRLGHRRLVAAEARRSVLVVAPTQAGKTTRFVVPNVLCWTGPLLVTSVKGDVLCLTAAERARRGATHVFDPTASAGMTPCRWSPLLACRTYADAERVAGWLVTAAGVPTRTRGGRGRADGIYGPDHLPQTSPKDTAAPPGHLHAIPALLPE